MAKTPITNFRLDPSEKAELQRLARERGTSLSEAFRHGARLYLESLPTVAAGVKLK